MSYSLRFVTRDFGKSSMIFMFNIYISIELKLMRTVLSLVNSPTRSPFMYEVNTAITMPHCLDCLRDLLGLALE